MLASQAEKQLRCFKKADFSGLRAFLKKNQPTDDSGDVKLLEAQFRDAIKKADELFVPRSRMRTSPLLGLPRSIQRLLRRRSTMFAKYSASLDPNDCTEFKRIRNSCKTEIRKHKAARQTEILQRAKQDRNYLFKYMRRRKKNKPSPLALLQQDGSHSSSPTEIADTFASHFVSVYSQHANTVFPILPDRGFTQELLTISIQPHMVETQLKKLDQQSAMGPDGIHPRILKETSSVLCNTLSRIFCQSLETGVLPSSWKRAYIAHIFKGGNRHAPESYRSISPSSVPCKLMERIIKKAILDHLIRDDLISPKQHGFVPLRSCVTNMLAFMDSLTDA